MPRRIAVPSRRCRFCHATMTRKRNANGRLENPADFRKRQFCDGQCKEANEEVTKRALYYRARKHLKKKCEWPGCEETEKLDIHHIDGNLFNFAEENTKTWCRMHHEGFHGRPIFRPWEDDKDDVPF